MTRSERLIRLAPTSKFHVHTVHRCVYISYCTRVGKIKCLFVDNAVKVEIIDCFDEQDFDDHTSSGQTLHLTIQIRLNDPVLAHLSFPGSMKHRILRKKVRLLA